jgi:hypothetical protein
MLVVANAYYNERTRPLVPVSKFFYCLRRTIKLLHRLSPLSPVFKTNMEVLKCAEAKVTRMYRDLNNGTSPQFVNSPTAGSAMTPGTPRYTEEPRSTATSFSAPM